MEIYCGEGKAATPHHKLAPRGTRSNRQLIHPELHACNSCERGHGSENERVSVFKSSYLLSEAGLDGERLVQKPEAH